MTGRSGPEGGCDCFEAACCGRDTGVAGVISGGGRRCGSGGGGGGGGMRDGLPGWGVSGVTEAPLLEVAEIESAPGERFPSLAFSARRARFASRAFLSASPRRSASCTTIR